MIGNPSHADQPVMAMGAPLSQAQSAVVMLHGRGASAGDILSLVPYLDQGLPPTCAYLAPQAANHTWYPYSFLAPLSDNEPHLGAALDTIHRIMAQLEAANIPPERVIVMGFSQGACLALEYAARHPRRYGGLAGLSGGLIGPPDHPFAYAGSLDGTPAYLGCSDIDPHIPLDRVERTAEVLQGMGASVTKEIFAGMAHTIISAELDRIRDMLAQLVASS
ncbi:MAG: dienelactone hydrolase family protein [Anaerolineae bacterium]